ncbi:RluA family pseudouridine synthase [Fulvivirga sediminis]|uniref:RNA pseudouridine synthase n=1 Tax=Fulvivirga sediminis TaxID=2803949 RepID=A0A937K0W8_9BACT|nr:RNA pseudouridine synthase [Fulvivirga sediminis]MBL3656725.1 RNA pseudouridine synthase [Fulvivirga sediminis]
MAKKIVFKDLILWENEDYIVINKPPFVSTLSDRNDDVNILALAKGYHEDAQVGHRLDKETSGALAIAKNPEAYRELSMQFENRKVEKLYHAVSDGIHDFNDLLVDLPIQKLSNGTVRIDKRSGKDAQTHFQTLKAYRSHTLVACKPVTGRMHQIRIHLAKQGAPIAGDNYYGGEQIYLSQFKKHFNLKRESEEQPLIKRLALHARSLEFSLINGERKSIEAPYPKDYQVLLKQLDKYA